MAVLKHLVQNPIRRFSNARFVGYLPSRLFTFEFDHLLWYITQKRRWELDLVNGCWILWQFLLLRHSLVHPCKLQHTTLHLLHLQKRQL
jgi:hypothetical protein